MRAELKAGDRLHVGCGARRLAGWVNADAAPGVGEVELDLLDESALPPGLGLEEAYACHVLEHLWPEDLPAALRRLLLALRPGGRLSVSVPDLRLAVANCVDGRAYGGEEALLSLLYGGSASRADAELDRHRQVFWRERLERLLLEAGFGGVRERLPGDRPELDALGDWSTWPAGPDGRSLASLNLEAARPL